MYCTLSITTTVIHIQDGRTVKFWVDMCVFLLFFFIRVLTLANAILYARRPPAVNKYLNTSFSIIFKQLIKYSHLTLQRQRAFC